MLKARSTTNPEHHMSTDTVGLHQVMSIETDKPGFIRDEYVTGLGTKLKLSSWSKSIQGMFEQHLPEIESASVVKVN